MISGSSCGCDKAIPAWSYLHIGSWMVSVCGCWFSIIGIKEYLWIITILLCRRGNHGVRFTEKLYIHWTCKKMDKMSYQNGKKSSLVGLGLIRDHIIRSDTVSYGGGGQKSPYNWSNFIKTCHIYPNTIFRPNLWLCAALQGLWRTKWRDGPVGRVLWDADIRVA